MEGMPPGGYRAPAPEPHHGYHPQHAPQPQYQHHPQPGMASHQPTMVYPSYPQQQAGSSHQMYPGLPPPPQYPPNIQFAHPGHYQQFPAPYHHVQAAPATPGGPVHQPGGSCQYSWHGGPPDTPYALTPPQSIPYVESPSTSGRNTASEVRQQHPARFSTPVLSEADIRNYKEKEKKRKERNRLAQQKSREKQKTTINQLLEEQRKWKASTNKFKKTIRKLKHEIKSLKQTRSSSENRNQSSEDEPEVDDEEMEDEDEQEEEDPEDDSDETDDEPECSTLISLQNQEYHRK